jgi:tripartite-type tricarboxylate transporter receptor subunit TctC
MGLLAPAGTPRDIVDALARAANEALRADDVLAPLRAQGFEPIGGTPEEFGRYIDSELKKWADVASAAGLKK